MKDCKITNYFSSALATESTQSELLNLAYLLDITITTAVGRFNSSGSWTSIECIASFHGETDLFLVQLTQGHALRDQKYTHREKEQGEHRLLLQEKEMCQHWTCDRRRMRKIAHHRPVQSTRVTCWTCLIELIALAAASSRHRLSLIQSKMENRVTSGQDIDSSPHPCNNFISPATAASFQEDTPFVLDELSTSSTPLEEWVC